MRVTVLEQVHARTASGRTFSRMDGTTADVDDDDAELVALIRDLDKLGMVRIVKADDDEADDKTATADKTAVVTPSATTKPSAAATKPSTRKA